MKNKKTCFFYSLSQFFFHYNFISIYADKDIKWNSVYTATTPHEIQNLQFNPDRFPHATLKVFNEFIEQYDFSYRAQYPEPLNHTIEAFITKWTATTKKEPTHRY